MYAQAFSYGLTFIVFPAAVDDSSYSFMQGMNNELSWYFLLNGTIFNVFDTVGRKTGAVPKLLEMTPKAIISVSASRIIFLATFLLVAFQVGPGWLFNSDWFKILNIMVFSFMNGFVGTICAIKAP